MRLATGDAEALEQAVEAATRAVRRGDLVVLPTDTVYGIGADAFDPVAVAGLLAAKGRGREMPPPVLVASKATLHALTSSLPPWVTPLVDAFWPGPLTLVCRDQSSLQWDLGDTRGTVAVRMPDHPVALAVLERTGPMAVSSANTSGAPAATDVDAAEAMLGEQVVVYVDAGPTASSQPSTILDVTGDVPRLLRLGTLSIERIDEVLEPTGKAVLVPDETD
ncbi:L-threonylcarbamoyladenylate synthase [Nocardioides alcanivorans]|uniref:L-threonylcarbamoyladenylate synthase n=1 Tax=Nocardioides alcanivorans TaxID=2897352 RepID=UPI001F385E00|nr:L-threonylcarbamoyladenylate synthase [Nocardioides alcanivorans]